MNHLWIPSIIVTAFFLVSCGSAQPGNAAEEFPQEPKPVPPHETLSGSENILPQPTAQESIEYSNAPVEKFASLVKNDLAQSLGISTEQIEVIATQTITWPNSALGCPAPGKVYAQGNVPGYRITIATNGQQYTYHTDLNGRFILCPSNDPDEGLPTGPTAGPNIDVPNK